MKKYIPVFIFALLLIMHAGISSAYCDPTVDSSVNFPAGTPDGSACLVFGVMGVVDTVAIDSSTTNILTSNMNPYVDYRFEFDMPYWLGLADSARTDGATVRNTLVLMGAPLPTVTPGIDQQTPRQKLLYNPNLNYEDVGLVRIIYDGTGSSRKPVECLIPNNIVNNELDIENRLITARDSYAYGIIFGTDKASAQLNFSETIKEYVNSYLMIGDEFLVDALEFRFSANVSPMLDAKLDEQIQLLTKAQLCYEKAVNSFVYGLGPLRNTDHTLADFYDDSLFSLYGLAIERRNAAMNEMAAKMQVRKLSPAPADQVAASQVSMGTLRDSAISTYMMGTSIANKQQAKFLTTGGDKVIAALSNIAVQSRQMKLDLNPMGFDDRFIFLQDFNVLNNLTKTYITNANTYSAALDKARQEVDATYDKYNSYLNTQTGNTGGYKLNLASLTGVSVDDQAFIEKIGKAGLDFFDCTFDKNQSDFSACTNVKSGGVLRVKYMQAKQRFDNVKLENEKRDNLRKEIQYEIDRYNGKLVIENMYANEQSVALDVFAREMDQALKRARDSDLSGQLTKIAAVGAAFALTYISAGTAGPIAFAAIGGMAAAYSNYQIQDDKLGIEVKKERDLQQALTKYRIRNLALDQETDHKKMIDQLVEHDIQIGIALQEFDVAFNDFVNALKEKDNYAMLYAKALKDVGRSMSDAMNSMGEARVIKLQETLNYANALNSAKHYAYLSAKALEYQNLTPLINLPLTLTSTLNISDLYKAQTPADVEKFRTDLESYSGQCGWGSVQKIYREISLVDNILALTPLNLNPSDPNNAVVYEQLKMERLQAYLAANVDTTSTPPTLRIKFASTVFDPNLNQGPYNIKLWFGTAPAQCTNSPSADGVAVGIDAIGQPASLLKAELYQSGHSTYLNKDGKVVEYAPVSSYTNFLSSNTDVVQPAVAYVDIPINNTPPANAILWSNGLQGRSIASSGWELVVKDFSQTQNRFDWSKLKDIKIKLSGLTFTPNYISSSN